MLLITSDKLLYDKLDLKNKELIFLSEYCLKDKKLIETYKSRIGHDIWENQDIKNKNLLYLQKHYEKLLKHLCDKLNLIHNLDEDKKYWEIIIGFWLHEFLGLAFIYYSKIKTCLEKFNIKYHLGSKINNNNLIPKNMKHFYYLSMSEIYNYNLSLEIINILNPNIELVPINLNLDKFEDNYNDQINNFKSLINKIYGKILININNLIKQKFYFDESYLTFSQKLNLAFYFKGLPTPDIENYTPKDKKIDLTIRNKLNFSDKFNDDKFINFFLSIVKDFMPMSYLENFKEINEYYLKRGSNCKYILSGNSFSTNDNFKIWSAKKIKDGSKYILSDHGDSFKKKYYSPDNVINNISDLTLQYNSKEKENKIFFNPNLLVKEKVKINKKNITIISLDNSWRPRRAASDLQSFSLYKSVEQIINLCETMDSNKISNYVIKSYKNRGINTSQLYKSHFNNKVSDKPLNKLYLNSSLVICTYPSTAFIEALFKKIPTILLYPEDAYYLDDMFDDLIRKMELEGLIFNCPKKCFNFLKKNHNNFDLWWNDKISNELKSSLENIFLKTNNIQTLAREILNI